MRTGFTVCDTQIRRWFAHLLSGRFFRLLHDQPARDAAKMLPRGNASRVVMRQNGQLSADQSIAFKDQQISFVQPSIGEKPPVIEYQSAIAIEFTSVSVDSGATSKSTVGGRSCIRNLSSSRQWLRSVWQAAWKATQNVAWPVQVPGLSQLKCLTQIQLAQPLQALPSAFFVTTQVSTPAAKVDTRTTHEHLNYDCRRRGFPPAAVLRFGDGN